MVGRQRPVQRLLPRDRHAVRLRGRAAARHRGQRRLHRLQGRRPGHQHPHRPVPRRVNCADAYEKAMASNAVDYVGVTDFGDYQPADEPTAWMVAPVGSGQPRRRRARAAVPDLQDQPADDRGQAVGRAGHGQDRRDLPGRTGRPDALRLAAVPRRTPSSTSATSSRRAHHPTWPRRRSGRAAPRWCSRSPPKRPGWPSAARRGTLITARLSRPRDAAGLRTGRPTRAALDWSIIAKIDTSEAFAPGRGVHPHTGAVYGRDHVRRLSRGHAAGAAVRAADPAGSRPVLSGSAPATTTSTVPVRVARRIRRSDSGVQRHEPQSRPSRRSCSPSSAGRTTGCCCR